MHQKEQWIPTLTIFVFLYPAGWLISHFSYFFNPNISSTNLRVIGTIITFGMFLSLLPSWGNVRWKNNNLWVSIGLDFKNIPKALKIFFSGFIFSVFLIIILLVFLFMCGWIVRFENIKITEFFNAILLILGIVFVEEIVFRGWLMEEMVLLFGLRRGVILQCAIFSFAHYRSDIGLLGLIPFFSGLFLLGLVLTLRRTIDKGSVLGCVGLHGGLVGIWYLFDAGMIIFSVETPFFFLGPTRDMVNPIGGVIGIVVLLVTIFFQRRIFASTGRFLASRVNNSFKYKTP